MLKDMNTVVVGFDGSDDARRAVRAAGDIVATDGVVHVVVAYKAPSEAETERMWRGVPDEFRGVYDVLAEPQGLLTEAERRLDQMGVSHAGRVVADHPASAILKIVDEVGADLVVVGSRGLGRAEQFVRGSVSTRVATHTHTSVLIVHSDDD
jgi:nucleotide-binding universal stress UspA family protein